MEEVGRGKVQGTGFMHMWGEFKQRQYNPSLGVVFVSKLILDARRGKSWRGWRGARKPQRPGQRKRRGEKGM